MNMTEMEFWTFLYLCGQEDRKLMRDEKKMTFADFERLEYISDKAGFRNLNLYIWRHYSPLFAPVFQSLLELIGDEYSKPYTDFDEEWEKQDKWITDFVNAIDDTYARAWFLKKIEQEECAGV